MKLKKGDKFILHGFEFDSQKNLSKIVFETVGGNQIEFFADGEKYQYHCIGRKIVEHKKLEEELEVP
jgi:hypothetical protein